MASATKSLLLLRHAKSDWDADFADDHERPLSKRGRRAASDIGLFIRRAGLVPDQVVTSTAIRARDTVVRAARAGRWSDVPRTETRELYGAATADVLRVLATVPDTVHRVLMAGHEPGWSTCVGELTGGSAVRMPTACLAGIQFDVDSWADCAVARGILLFLVPPRTLAGLFDD